MPRTTAPTHSLRSIQLWDREIVDDYRPRRSGSRGWSSALKTTRADDVALIYASGSDPGIARLVWFTEDAEPDPHWRYGAAGLFVPVEPEISRAELLAVPELEPVFGPLRGRRNLAPDAADELFRRFDRLGAA